MTPEITAAQRAVLDHLLEPDNITLCVIPSALAGHYPPGSDAADMRIDWLLPFPVFTHPADPARLLVGVDTDQGQAVTALDHIAHLYCDHPICTGVVDQRLHELAEIPADAGVFAAMDVLTSWGGPLLYVIHIEDHLAAEAKGWDGELTDHIELSHSWT